MLRVVFDTVVFVRSLINPYSFYGQIVFRDFSRYRLFVSQPVITELIEVLHRPELRRKFRTLAQLDVARVIELVGQAEAVEFTPLASVSRDPKDDKFLATAVAARADYLVSEDQDLLVLQTYHGLQIVTCEAFLELLQRTSAESSGGEAF
jgi:putative PIN family toxin of toxin-antitoxin system